jgi:cyanate lyase
MNKFLEAKEKKGVSYSDIAKAVGNGYPDAQAVCNILHSKRASSIELLTKIGAFLGLPDIQIQEAFLEQQIKWTEKELERKKKKLLSLREDIEKVVLN